MLRIASCLAALCLLGAASAHAAPDDAAGDKQIHDYVLTMDKVKAYEAADANLQAAANSNAMLRNERWQMSREPDATPADLIAKFDRHPNIFIFYSKRGLSTADAALIPIALMSACSAAQSPALAQGMAGTVSPQQIEFCKANMSELQSMPILSTGD